MCCCPCSLHSMCISVMGMKRLDIFQLIFPLRGDNSVFLCSITLFWAPGDSSADLESGRMPQMTSQWLQCFKTCSDITPKSSNQSNPPSRKSVFCPYVCQLFNCTQRAREQLKIQPENFAGEPRLLQQGPAQSPALFCGEIKCDLWIINFLLSPPHISGSQPRTRLGAGAALISLLGCSKPGLEGALGWAARVEIPFGKAQPTLNIPHQCGIF